MTVIQIENPLTLLKCKENAIKKIMLGAREVQIKFLRDQFEDACVDATALAVIMVAEGLGFDELSIEFMTKLAKK